MQRLKIIFSYTQISIIRDIVGPCWNSERKLIKSRPQIRQGYPLNLGILIRRGTETNKDSLSNGKWSGNSSDVKSPTLVSACCSCKKHYLSWSVVPKLLGTVCHRGWQPCLWLSRPITMCFVRVGFGNANTYLRPIANKYRGRKMKRTLKRDKKYVKPFEGKRMDSTMRPLSFSEMFVVVRGLRIWIDHDLGLFTLDHHPSLGRELTSLGTFPTWARPRWMQHMPLVARVPSLWLVDGCGGLDVRESYSAWNPEAECKWRQLRRDSDSCSRTHHGPTYSTLRKVWGRAYLLGPERWWTMPE